MSGRDLVDFPWDKPAILGIQDLRYNSRNVMARDRAFYAGHAVAAVAATSTKIAAAAVKLIEVDYEVLPWVIDVDEALRAGRAHPARGHGEGRRQARARDDIQHRRQARAHAGRRRGGVCRCRSRRRAQLQDQAGAPGLYRAARLPRQRRQERPDHHLEQQPGPLHGARHDGPAHRHQAQRHPRHPCRDRRRFRRQDHRLPGAAGAGAVAQVGPPGEDGDVARGGVPRHGPDVGVVQHSQDRRHQGRQDHRREGDLPPAGRRLPGLAHSRRGRLRALALRPRQRADHRLRHRHQPAQGCGLPRARRADRRLRHGMHARRIGGQP